MTRRPRARRAGPRRPRAGPSRRTPGRIVVAAAAILALILAFGGWRYLGPGPGRGVDVMLPAGAGLAGIGRDLAKAGVVRSQTGFIIAAVLSGAAHRLKAGEYRFGAREPLAQVISAIARGEVVRRFVTIPEGLTSREVVAILLRADYLAGPAPVPPEGSLLPETYEVRRGERRSSVLQRMAAAREQLLGQLWAARTPGLPFDSKEQAVILASVVEKETALAAERPQVAAVFINRLRKGMRLESDPTVIYGVSGGAPLGHGLRVSELAASSPYNTYRVAGLPPTPIDNPGRASLAAALSPAPGAALYFVADGAGGHAFADTFEAHRRNVARWRAIEQARRARPAA
ncbi:MAG TPA: endolytic transglycosylase MltG [Caulobacteraceae bacterium]|nr:endolytic transglycosylase MltG [Caulobacteraceae bacterium]